MRVFSHHLTSALEELPKFDLPGSEVDLVIVHGNPFSLADPSLIENFKATYPNACIAGCSSAGELLNGKAFQNAIVYSAIQFEHSRVQQKRVDLPTTDRDEYGAGKTLAKKLEGDQLSFVLLFSEGLAVDCDELIRGMCDVLGKDVTIFGGLAGDNLMFEHTVVLDRDGIYDNSVVAVGFYGDRLNVATASSSFDQGGEHIEITASDGNMATEFNHQPALNVYDRHLSKFPDPNGSLPLHFPLIILDPVTMEPLYCRTVHERMEEKRALLSAGTVPEGPALIIDLQGDDTIPLDAKRTSQSVAKSQNEFALVVSCAARQAAMGEEHQQGEAAAVRETLGDVETLGFYSYGEIGCTLTKSSTVVHNHTLNIATFHEA